VDELAGWARAAREGDPVAVAALVRATQSEVHRLCAHLVDHASADDLAQETYLRALRALPSYEARSPFRPWLLASPGARAWTPSGAAAAGGGCSPGCRAG
jgi:RNA polymerase sigma-70 factor (ECF subfamily)